MLPGCSFRGGELNQTDWNAVAYDDLSDPMFEWGMAVLGTLDFQGGERILDAGCGSGRLTEELLHRLPSGVVVALDSSPKMLEQARLRLAKFGKQVEFVGASLQNFELPQKVDGIFSNAVFHWVPDHEEMFRALYRALKQAGWLVAQFGGAGNLTRTYRRAKEAASHARFRTFLNGVVADTPHFEGPEETRTRMETAGFNVKEARLHTVTPRFERRERYEAFLKTVVLHSTVAELPVALQQDFLTEISMRTWEEEKAYSLDYVRLTVRATAV